MLLFKHCCARLSSCHLGKKKGHFSPLNSFLQVKIFLLFQKRYSLFFAVIFRVAICRICRVSSLAIHFLLFLDRSRTMPYTYRDPSARAPSVPQNACVTHSSGQTYQELKLECQQKGILFEDCDFLANDSSLFYNEKPQIPFVWKRPGVSLNRECIFYELKFVPNQTERLSLRMIVKCVMHHEFHKKW